MVKSEPAPQTIAQWCVHVKSRTHSEDVPAVDLVAIVVRFVSLHASTEGKGHFVDSSAVVREASQLEHELDHWKTSLPISWCYRVVRASERREDIYNGNIHTYRDLWTARVWNNYRQTRIRVNEMILLQAGLLNNKEVISPDKVALRRRGIAVISKMAEDICASVSCHFHQHTDKEAVEQKTQPVSGVYFILCPLAIAASAIGILNSVHEFAISRLEAIGKTRGIQQALILASGARVKRAKLEAKLKGGHVPMPIARDRLTE
jgi:hypothetical protein